MKMNRIIHSCLLALLFFGMSAGYAEKHPADINEDPPVVERTDSTSGDTYVWKDGDRVRRVQMQNDLLAKQAGDDMDLSGDEVVAKYGTIYIVKKRGVKNEGGMPVFRGNGGQLMALPGGVLLVFESGLNEEAIDNFFTENQIDRSKVSTMNFTKNAFFVETEVGMASMELANELADKDGVVISSPNWWRETETR